MNINTTFANLSPSARALFAEILIAEQIFTSDVDYRDGWDELVEANLVNTWSDDIGRSITSCGRQL